MSMSDTEKSEAGGEKVSTRTRSPAYPALSLPTALKRAQEIWNHEKRNPVSLTVLASDWEIGAKSSTFPIAVSALKKYGFLEDVPGGKERLLKLTNTALNIILNEDGDSPERISLLKRCALSPRIYRELWSQFN